MLNFDFCSPTRIVFGRDAQHKIGGLISPYGKKVLIHYGGGSVKRSGLLDAVTASLRAAGLDFVELGGVVPNPRLSLVHEGIALCKREKVDLILAVGGGSAIDSSKAIAMGVYYDGEVWDIYVGKASPAKALPVATILTIPAAGSESSDSSVITNEECEIKNGYSNFLTRPILSVVNPELFFTLPKNQIANGVADMMSHILERYFTNTTHVDLTDSLCEATLRTIMKNALILERDQGNYDAWAEVGFGGSLAHNSLLGMGRAEDWACHSIEHELSAIYDVAHGAGLAVLTPNWMQYVYKENINMFVQFAVNVMGVEASFRDPETIVDEGVRRLRGFFAKLGLPSTLRELGIGEDKLELMAKKTVTGGFNVDGAIGGFKKLRYDDVLAILKLSK
jgi:alcohol dehydrogenase YqhD (iron-dependent ADH family)